ncbi:PTS transporter subunit EIIC [Shewanella psychrotolerans]|uniref:PTS transporter subunit EIIC n=1 Tax=Shewanella psychrotolerans TaxID=2864206 RepID=UPI001C65D39C|nr:PTS transporter subunit EIIC [Shewanella psychrotolerans]QYK02515.1 PTS transporter subunit EIIC [Shewanella psychrotolerans]
MVNRMEQTHRSKPGRLGQLSSQWFKFAQRLSQSLLLPIAILPAAGVMIGLATNPVPYISENASILMLTIGNLIFSMMPMLFAVTVAIGFCRDQGIAAFSAVFGYGVFFSSLSALIKIHHIQTQTILGAETIDTGIAGGILVGVITCIAVSQSERIRLPAVFSFFEGHRSAPLLMLPLSILLAYLFLLVWPPLSIWIEQVSNWAVYQEPAFAFALYGTVERLLIPLGLHHIWNAPFYLEMGQYVTDTEVFRGEVARYLAGDPQAGNLAGGYLIKMWGLPAAALAIWRCADKSERNRVAGIMLSAASACWLTGVTEPVEFAFMFVAPLLFIVHAMLTGLAYAVAISLDIHHSVVFSHGLVDFSLLMGQSRNVEWFWILGPLTAVIYYLLFRASILAFNLKTPGRVSDDGINTVGIISIIKAVGGKDNINELTACLTRLRISLKHASLVDKSLLNRLDAKGVVVLGNGVQIVYGTKAERIRRLLQRYLDRHKL